jgi:hypothetical protein
MCYWENVITEDRAAMLDQAREEIRAARLAAVAIVTPLLVDEFLQRLLRGPIVTRALEEVA